MNQYDVAGVLKTYAEQAIAAKGDRDLKDIVRKLKQQFDSDAIRKLKVEK